MRLTHKHRNGFSHDVPQNSRLHRALPQMDRKLLSEKLRNLRARRERVARVIAKVSGRLAGHIDDHDLESYHLGMVEDEAELRPLEEHLLWCGGCVERAEAIAQYVDAVRAAACGL